MRAPISLLVITALGLTVPATALAQETTGDRPAVVETAAGSTAAQLSAPVASPSPSAPATAQPAPAPVPPQGQWVYTQEYGWIWVPLGTVAYTVDEQPYVYIYTPVYGWTWYVSPWGWGPFYVGTWVSRPWGYGPRVWVSGRWVAPAYHGYYRGGVVFRGGYRFGHGAYREGFHAGYRGGFHQGFRGGFHQGFRGGFHQGFRGGYHGGGMRGGRR